jgi:hypothetical protein
MIHAFVDTNIFLSLYAYTDDNISELNGLTALLNAKKLKLYVSQTVNQEFYRNRDKKIFESLGNLQKFQTSLSLPRFVEHHEEAEKLRELLREVRNIHGILVKKVQAEIDEQELAADKLFKQIRDLAGVTPLSEAAKKSAVKRRDSGNPPGKDGSLGDRLNWEMLLEKVPEGEDVHIVSRDKDFSSPFGPNVPNSFLSNEWNAKKKSKLYIYNSLKSFVKVQFPEIALSSDAAKTLAIKALVGSKSWQKTHDAIAALSPHISDITSDEAIELFEGLVQNSEIHDVSADKDVEYFYQSLINDHFDAIPAELYAKIMAHIEEPGPF